MKKQSVLKLTESAVMIALATILSLLAIFKMPYGGSVTACSMLPIIIIAYRHNVVWGLLTGLAHAMLQCIMGLDNLAYATSFAAGVAIVMLDYILAFTCLGLGGIFKGKIKSDGTALALGALVCCIIRYVCHVISGCTVWAGVSIPDAQGLIFSLGYNLAYMLPEAVVTVAAAYFAGKCFDFTQNPIRRRARSDNSGMSVIGAMILCIAVVVDSIMLFMAMQSEDGYDITLIKDNANWVQMLVILGVGILGMIVANIIKKYKTK